MDASSTKQENHFSFYLWPKAKSKKRSLKIGLSSCGRPKQHRPSCDPGTPELQRKRRQLLGRKHCQNLSLSTLDALYAQGLIDIHQHQAGRSYVALQAAASKVMLSPQLRESAKELIVGSGSKKLRAYRGPDVLKSEKKATAIEKKWRASQEVLLNQSRGVFDRIHQVVVFEELELESILSSLEILQQVRQGLKTLDEFFNGLKNRINS